MLHEFVKAGLEEAVSVNLSLYFLIAPMSNQ